MARTPKLPPSSFLADGEPLERHPAWRNPEATPEEADDLRARCPHPGIQACAGTAFDPTSPTLMTFWMGCGDCGLLRVSPWWRGRKPNADELARDRRVMVQKHAAPEYAVVLMRAGVITRDEARLVALV